MTKALSLAILLLAVANVASAGQNSGSINTIITDVCNDFPKWDGKIDSTGLCKGKVLVTAPEIDAASAMAGMTILLAGLAVVRGRRAKRSKE